jgi:hypothetical protein
MKKAALGLHGETGRFEERSTLFRRVAPKMLQLSVVFAIETLKRRNADEDPTRL